MEDSVGKATLKVCLEHLASSTGTGKSGVLSASVLASLMEEAAFNALKTACMISGQTSITSKMSVKYERLSAPGANVSAVARVTDIDRNGIHFEIEAFDETGLIGTATHTRVFVEKAEYEKKCYETARLARSIKTK